MRLTVAITGASGVVYGKRLLEELKKKEIETHLVISKAAKKIINLELDTTQKTLEKLADHYYDVDDWSSPIVSGSFKTDAMIIIPCSMKTLAGIASGYTENIILRAADVTLKENNKLIIVPRETPLNYIHLKNMLELSKIGVIIVPSMPAFYHNPQTIGELIDFIVGRILDLLGVKHSLYTRWNEIGLKL